MAGVDICDRRTSIISQFKAPSKWAIHAHIMRASEQARAGDKSIDHRVAEQWTDNESNVAWNACLDIESNCLLADYFFSSNLKDAAWVYRWIATAIYRLIVAMNRELDSFFFLCSFWFLVMFFSFVHVSSCIVLCARSDSIEHSFCLGDRSRSVVCRLVVATSYANERMTPRIKLKVKTERATSKKKIKLNAFDSHTRTTTTTEFIDPNNCWYFFFFIHIKNISFYAFCGRSVQLAYHTQRGTSAARTIEHCCREETWLWMHEVIVKWMSGGAIDSLAVVDQKSQWSFESANFRFERGKYF